MLTIRRREARARSIDHRAVVSSRSVLGYPKDAKTFRILDLEDDPLEAEHIQANLAEGGIPCEITRVETREEFVAALRSGDFELILSDYSLPSFDGLSALKLAKEIRPEVPFILVSGAIGEERAIKGLKTGATDYVLKQRLERLVRGGPAKVSASLIP